MSLLSDNIFRQYESPDFSVLHRFLKALFFIRTTQQQFWLFSKTWNTLKDFTQQQFWLAPLSKFQFPKKKNSLNNNFDFFPTLGTLWRISINNNFDWPPSPNSNSPQKKSQFWLFFQDLEHSEGYNFDWPPSPNSNSKKKKKKSLNNNFDFFPRLGTLWRISLNNNFDYYLKVSNFIFLGEGWGVLIYIFFLVKGGKCYIINMYCVLELGLGLGFFFWLFFC